MIRNTPQVYLYPIRTRVPGKYPPKPRKLGVPEAMTRIAIISFVICLPFLLFLSLPLAWAAYQSSDLIAPGISAGGVDLGLLNSSQAVARLDKEWNTDRRIEAGWISPETVHSWLVTPADLGIHVDAVRTTQEAVRIGRGRGIISNIVQVLSGIFNRQELPLVVNFDPQVARKGLGVLADMSAQAPINASLHLEGARLVADPGKAGLTLDVEKALASLSADPRQVLFQGYLLLSIQPVSPGVTDVSAVIAEAENMLAAPPKVRAYDPISDEWFDWAVPREVMASWLVIKDDGQGPKIEIDLTHSAGYLAERSNTLGPERWIDVPEAGERLAQSFRQHKQVTLIVRHKPTTYTVQGGETLMRIGWKVGMPYWMLLEANPGINANALRSGQEITIPSKDELLPLPVVPDKRIVISITEQHMWTYENGVQRSEHVISTGIDRSPTQPGIYQVRTHELNAYASIWNLTMPHFLGIYEAWPGFMNGIHGLPMLSNGQRLWANILGRPASYGCIILNLADAEDLYQWAENGVVVEIKP